MDLDIWHLTVPSRLDRLVDNIDLQPHRYAIKNRLDRLGEHANAAPACPHTDPVGLVGAVYEVTRDIEQNGMPAQRVIRPRWHHGRRLLATCSRLLTYRTRWIPGGILKAHGDRSFAQRCIETFTADADGVGFHPRGLTFVHRRVVVEPQLCDIDYHPFTLHRWQDKARRNGDFRALAR